MPLMSSVVYDVEREVANVHKASIIDGRHRRGNADRWCGTHSLLQRRSCVPCGGVGAGVEGAPCPLKALKF